GVGVVMTWSAAWSAVACATMTAVYVIGALLMWREPGTTDFAHHIVRLVVTSIVTIGATAIRGRRRWQDVVNVLALERARAESRETEARYQLLIDTAGSAIVVLSPDYRVLEFNREAETIYGWSRAEVLGKDYLQLFLPTERRAEVAGIIQEILDGATLKGFEGTVRARSGEERIILWNARPLTGSGDRTLGVIGIG